MPISLSVYGQARPDQTESEIEHLVGRQAVAAGQVLASGQQVLEFEIAPRELPRVARKLKKAGLMFTTNQESTMTDLTKAADDAKTPKVPAPTEQPRLKTIIIRPDVGLRLVHDYDKRQYVIQFEEKPSEDLLAHVKPDLKNAKTRWDSEIQGWARKLQGNDDWRTRADMEKLVIAVADKMLAFAQAKGEPVAAGQAR